MKQLQALFAYLKALFLKLVNLKKTPAPSPVVTPTAAPVVISDPVVKPVVVTPTTPVAVAPAPSITDALFPNANQAGTDARSQPSSEPIPPDYFVMDGMLRNGRTALVYGSDNGLLFGAKPGTTTYTITIPTDAKALQALWFVKDGVKTGKETCTVSVNGGPAKDVYQGGDTSVTFPTPGYYTVVVTCDSLFTINPNFA